MRTYLRRGLRFLLGPVIREIAQEEILLEKERVKAGEQRWVQLTHRLSETCGSLREGLRRVDPASARSYLQGRATLEEVVRPGNREGGA